MAFETLRPEIGHGAKSGMTLLEVTGALAISSMLLLSLADNLSRSGSALTISQRRASLQLDNQRSLDEVAGHLKDAVASSLTPDPLGPLGSSDLGFARLTDFVNGVPVWGQSERLTLRIAPEELLDGIDQDGDGLVDEHQLIYTHGPLGGNQKTVILCNGLPALGAGETANGLDDDGDGLIDEPSFVVVRNGDMLELFLTVWMPESAESGTGWQVLEGTRQVALRN